MYFRIPNFRRMKLIITFLFTLLHLSFFAQLNLVTYAGNDQKETFFDVMQLSDGSILVTGYCENLDWINANVPVSELSGTSGIHNGLGTNRFPIIIRFSADLQTMLEVVHMPQGAAEDIRFIKATNIPGDATGDLYISGNTSDTYNNDGGYFLARLDNNFVNGTPQSLVWTRNVWAESGPKDYQPWDVTSAGEVYYISGQNHAYDWSAMYKLDINGERMVVDHWRTHWFSEGGEWRGTPASDYVGINTIAYSGIVLKTAGRCELRSWTSEEYNLIEPDGNGGTRMGKWPLDVMFSGPCDPENPTTDGPGYTGYSPESCCPVLGGTCIAVDRRNDHVYLGMNMKTYGISPDFEPAVIAMTDQGAMKWWSRLYHEITPQGEMTISVPDQYVDALAIDYSLPVSASVLVVGARAHGNNTENLWEGNSVFSNPDAYGFQNQFTGTNGDIHESWIGKLKLETGEFVRSTFVAELTNNTGNLGTPHADPNLDNWPDPNTGWPNVNTTRMARNAMEITADGSVCIAAVGRRTITTANAWQKMVKPEDGGNSCWNSFIRVYKNDLTVPLYSSLVVGQWDTLTEAGGDNTELFGLCKTQYGIIGVGRQKADNNNAALGYDIPVVNVPGWGVATPSNESAILVYLVAENLENEDDSPVSYIPDEVLPESSLRVFPNPADHHIQIRYARLDPALPLCIYSPTGSLIKQIPHTSFNGNIRIDIPELASGIYFLKAGNKAIRFVVE